MLKKSLFLFGLLIMGVAFSKTTSTVFAATSNKDVPVSYKNSNDIPDPENPENPEYVISVPAAINFSENRKLVDATILMTNPDGSGYQGSKAAEVSVSSKNQFKLVNKEDKITYKLITITNGQGKVVTDKIGRLDKSVSLIEGKARLEGIAKNAGLYTDTLTYTVTSIM